MRPLSPRATSLVTGDGTAPDDIDIFFARFCFHGQRREDWEQSYLTDLHSVDERNPAHSATAGQPGGACRLALHRTREEDLAGLQRSFAFHELPGLPQHASSTGRAARASCGLSPTLSMAMAGRAPGSKPSGAFCPTCASSCRSGRLWLMRRLWDRPRPLCSRTAVAGSSIWTGADRS